MKYLAKSGLFVLCICIAYALFAFFDTQKAETEKKTFSQVENVNHQLVYDFKIERDVTTGLPLLVHHSNSILYTADIGEEQSKKLLYHFRETSFFTNTSSNKIMIGKEPNNYILFYQLKTSDSIPYLQLQAFAVGISANVFNHQPVVVKLINEEKEVIRIVTSL